MQAVEPVFASPNQGLQADRQLVPREGRRWTKILCVLGTLVLLTAVVGRTDAADADASPTDAIGRLIIDGQRLCTAFVVWSGARRGAEGLGGRTTVYEHWLATAGHCYGGEVGFQQGGEGYEGRGIGFWGGGGHGFGGVGVWVVCDRAPPALEAAFGAHRQV